MKITKLEHESMVHINDVYYKQVLYVADEDLTKFLKTLQEYLELRCMEMAG